MRPARSASTLFRRARDRGSSRARGTASTMHGSALFAAVPGCPLQSSEPDRRRHPSRCPNAPLNVREWPHCASPVLQARSDDGAFIERQGWSDRATHTTCRRATRRVASSSTREESSRNRRTSFSGNENEHLQRKARRRQNPPLTVELNRYRKKPRPVTGPLSVSGVLLDQSPAGEAQRWIERRHRFDFRDPEPQDNRRVFARRGHARGGPAYTAQGLKAPKARALPTTPHPEVIRAQEPHITPAHCDCDLAYSAPITT